MISFLELGLKEVVIGFFVSFAIWVFCSQQRHRKTSKDGVPVVPGIPILGSVGEIFSSPTTFVTTTVQKYGDKFYCNVVGSEWIFIANPQDIKYIFSLTDKSANFIEATLQLFGFLFPSDHIGIKKQYSQDLKMYLDKAKCPATKHIAYSLRPNIISAWIPTVQEVIQKSLHDLPSGNNCKLDLFDFARVTISCITTMLMIGKKAFDQPGFLRTWTDLFLETDMEASMGDPYSAVSTMLEVALLGERRIYKRVRELLYPMVDAEIEACIKGVPLPQNPSALESMVRYRYERDTFKGDPDRLRQSRTRIANDLFGFSTAAFSNSFAGAGWVLYHLLKNTNGIGKKVRQEINDWKSSPELQANVPQSLQNCILEVTRLYTPGHSIRTVKQPIKLPSNGHTLQPGVTTAVNHFYTYRQGFTNPLSFDPTRFDRGEHKENLFFGFGMGTHPCVGKPLAMLEIAMFCQESLDFGFRVLPPDNETRDGAFMDTIIDVKDHPNLEKRQSAFLWRPQNPIFLEYDKK